MSKDIISPDQIKSIAAELRRTEQDRLGTKLPNTTALNAITRALGLGPDFRAFKASFSVTKETTTSDITESCLAIAIQNEDVDMSIFSFETHQPILKIIEEKGFTGEVAPGSHGFSLVSAWSEGNKHNLQDLKALKEELLTYLKTLQEGDEIEEIMGAVYWQDFASDRQLAINFRYHDNNQVCSTTVSESYWRARHQLGRCDELALLINPGDNEISAHYTLHDITIEDVLLEVTPWIEV